MSSLLGRSTAEKTHLTSAGIDSKSNTSLTTRSCTEAGILFFKAHLPLTALEKILPELFFEAATSTTLNQG